MNSIIIVTTARFLRPLLLLFSLFVLLRGHHEPGGGFAGGLLAAAAFSLQAITRSVGSARRKLRVDPHLLIGVGLLVAFASGAAGLLSGQPFLTGLWWGPLSTVLLFDVGVYLCVMGVILMIVFTLAEE